MPSVIFCLNTGFNLKVWLEVKLFASEDLAVIMYILFHEKRKEVENINASNNNPFP